MADEDDFEEESRAESEEDESLPEEGSLLDEIDNIFEQEVSESRSGQISVQQLGFSLYAWRESLSKRIVEMEAGRGGVEALCQYADQLGNIIPELRPLRYAMKNGTILYETALAKCSKDLLKRPPSVRENEVVEALGCVCEKCGFRSTFRVLIKTKNSCPKCGNALPGSMRARIQYVKVLTEMIDEGLDPTPEAVLMYLAYGGLADSFTAMFKAVKLILDFSAKAFGQEYYIIDEPQLRSYLDAYHLGRFAGETKTSREEKEVLQFIARFCIALARTVDVGPEEAERLIRLALKVVTYGYLFQVLSVSGADAFYMNAVSEYDELYDRMNEEIRKAYLEMYVVPVSEKPQVTLADVQEGVYAPCFIMPRAFWESGSVSKNPVIRACKKLPVFPKADFGALQAVFAPIGGGKTFLMSAVACYSILSKHELVFCPINDESNSYSLAGIPLFGYNERIKELLKTLSAPPSEGGLGVEPRGVPTVTLYVLRKDEVHDINVNKHPPTIYDRIVEVDGPNFELDFRQVMRELKEIAELYGYSNPVGFVCVRNLQRQEDVTRTNFDIQVTASLLSQFNRWRKGNLSQPARVIIDEVSYLASAELPAQYAGDAARSKSVMSDFIKESRRNNLSVDMATQRPLEVISDIRDAATNVFFRDLPMSRDKTRSQIDFLVDSLQLAEPEVRGIIAEINNRGLLDKVGKGYWFWYHRPAKRVNVIRPAPPTFCLQDKDMTPMQILRRYEKETGQKVLLGSWDEVKRLGVTESKDELDVNW